MEIFASNNRLTKNLSNQRSIIREYGKDRGKRIVARLDEFKNANNLAEIPSDPPPRCHLLSGNLKNKFAVDVSKNYRIVFEGYDKDDNLSTKKSQIVTVQITEIEDYH